MAARWWLSLGCLLAAAAVVLGAFGAHGLPKRLEAEGLSTELQTTRLDQYETATRYHMYHALALVLVGLMARSSGGMAASVAGGCFLAGIAMFCGPLYSLVLSGRSIVAIIPIGGLTFIVGWLALAWAAIRGVL